MGLFSRGYGRIYIPYTQILDLNLIILNNHSPVHGHDKAWSAVATLTAIVLSNGCLDRVETSLGTINYVCVHGRGITVMHAVE